jgi:hypothetical protein
LPSVIGTACATDRCGPDFPRFGPWPKLRSVVRPPRAGNSKPVVGVVRIWSRARFRRAGCPRKAERRWHRGPSTRGWRSRSRAVRARSSGRAWPRPRGRRWFQPRRISSTRISLLGRATPALRLAVARPGRRARSGLRPPQRGHPSAHRRPPQVQKAALAGSGPDYAGKPWTPAAYYFRVAEIRVEAPPRRLRTDRRPSR